MTKKDIRPSPFDVAHPSDSTTRVRIAHAAVDEACERVAWAKE